MILPIGERREEGGGDRVGERLHSDAPYDEVGDPRQGLDKSVRSYPGETERERKRKGGGTVGAARDRERDRERAEDSG